MDAVLALFLFMTWGLAVLSLLSLGLRFWAQESQEFQTCLDTLESLYLSKT